MVAVTVDTSGYFIIGTRGFYFQMCVKVRPLIQYRRDENSDEIVVGSFNEVSGKFAP